VSSATDEEPLRFGQFEIRPAERVLRVDGRDVAVGARAFDLLLVLARRRERLVTKQDLLDLVWPGVVVEEHNIAAHISTLRKLPVRTRLPPCRGGLSIHGAAAENARRTAAEAAGPDAVSVGRVRGSQTHLPHQLTAAPRPRE